MAHQLQQEEAERMIIISRLLISLHLSLSLNIYLSIIIDSVLYSHPLTAQYYNDGWSRLKKRPASKGHRRVALLEEEPGKLSLSNRKLRTSMVPPREIGRRRTTKTSTANRATRDGSEKEARKVRPSSPLWTGGGSAIGEFSFLQSKCVAPVEQSPIPKIIHTASTFSKFFGLKIAGWGATAASAGAYHGGIAAAAAAMKGTTDLGPHTGYHPAHHQLMADMYQGMSPATAINTMDWKNTSQVRALL